MSNRPLFDPTFRRPDDPGPLELTATGSYERNDWKPWKPARTRNLLLASVGLAVIVIAFVAYSGLAFSEPPDDCDSGYETFPEANTTVIYMQTTECTQYRLKKLLAEPSLTQARPSEKMEDSLLPKAIPAPPEKPAESDGCLPGRWRNADGTCGKWKS